MIGRVVLTAASVAASVVAFTPPAGADICAYPMVGVGAQVIVGRGFFCDGPTEVNGSHWHCEAGGVGLGGSGTFTGDMGSIGVGGLGVGGASCSWRCPDNTLAPQPNPPGAWKTYLVPHPAACTDHMDPAGFWSEPVRPEEGAPPDGGAPP